ncbi:MAG: V-type ATPase subunit [Dehalococcoidia bacterium]|nr:V-type ATP synthase subunit C [Chloroflexota bacterium]MBT9162336.1 V-type ATP synthase subunit C [Chloroflexota bacterium]
MINPRYAFATAYLKAAESRLVTSEHLEGMLRASNLPEALELIQDTDIGSYLRRQTINKFDAFDASLWEYLQEHIEHLEGLRILPDEMHTVLQKHLVKYDVLNIKAALQGIAAHQKARMIPVGVICSRGLLDELSDAAEIEGIIEISRRCGLERYADILSRESRVESRESGRAGDSRLQTPDSGLQMIGSQLDNAYYQDYLATAKSLTEGHLLTKSLGFIIDLLNLQMVLRSVGKRQESRVKSQEPRVDSQESGKGGDSRLQTPDSRLQTLGGGYMLSGEIISELLSLKLPDIPGRLEDTFYYQVGQDVLVSYEKTHSLTAIEEVIDKHKFQLLRDILMPRVMSSLLMPWYLILKEMELRNLRLVAKSLLDNLEGAKNLLVVNS